MKDSPKKKRRGKVNYVWVLAGGYLVYLATQLFGNVISGKSDTPAIGIAGGVVFVVIGCGLLIREWRAYQYGRAHIDDPETWNDDPVEVQEITEDAEKPEEGEEHHA